MPTKIQLIRTTVKIYLHCNGHEKLHSTTFNCIPRQLNSTGREKLYKTARSATAKKTAPSQPK